MNIRAAAGTGSRVVGSYSRGAKITILEKKTVGNTQWGRTDKGWVSLQYVDIEEPQAPVDPVVPPVTQWEGKVTATTLNIRATAGANGRYVGYYVKGTKIVILEKKTVGSAEWGRTDKGWVSLQYVDIEEPQAPVVPPVTQWEGKVTATTLNIRATADTNGRYLGYYVKGTKIVILEKKTVGSAEWGRTDKGWICLTYVTIEKTPEPVDPNPGTNPDPGTDPNPGTDPDPIVPPAETWKGTVTGSSLNIRAAAGTSGRVVDSYAKGTKVVILEKKLVGSTQWGRTDKGWISLQYVKLESDAPQPVVKTVTADVLRVRSGAGTSYAVTARLSNGAKVTILETKTVGGIQWGRIAQGWISMQYVK